MRRKIRIHLSKEKLLGEIDLAFNGAYEMAGAGPPGLIEIQQDQTERIRAVVKQVITRQIAFSSSFLIVTDQQRQCGKRKCPGVLFETGEVSEGLETDEFEIGCTKCNFLDWV